jgi:microcystin-dependent protein
MAESFIGQIKTFSFGFVPRYWLPCDGRTLQIAQNAALFSLLGTTYGGNGQTTFALPDFRGSMPIHWGSGPGLTGRSIGERAGTETEVLLTSQMPMHTHFLTASANNADLSLPTNNFLGGGGQAVYNAASSLVPMASAVVETTGAGQAHSNQPPYLALTLAICVAGIFPSRN